MPELTKTQYEDDYISLKWGTFKSYKLSNPVFDPLIEEYNQLGTSMSAMAQCDTLRQKEIICEMIDIIGKDVYLDWDGEYVSPAEAKKYVMGYRL